MKQVKPTNVPALRPSAEVVQITPAIAEQMLGKNTRNRNVRPGKVDALARDMVAGRWVYNGETIKVSPDGTILDGQHRLLAVVESGETIAALVVRNLPPEAQDTIDTGTRRAFSDQLKFKGECNATLLASVLRRVIMWEKGHRISSGGYQPTEREMKAYLGSHPELRLSAELATFSRPYVSCPPSLIALSHHLFHRLDPESCSVFFQQFVEGVGVQYGDPAHALRKRLQEYVANGGSTREAVVLPYIIHAWNLHRDGKKVQRLNAPKGGWTSENFPMPR